MLIIVILFIVSTATVRAETFLIDSGADKFATAGSIIIKADYLYMSVFLKINDEDEPRKIRQLKSAVELLSNEIESYSAFSSVRYFPEISGQNSHKKSSFLSTNYSFKNQNVSVKIDVRHIMKPNDNVYIIAAKMHELLEKIRFSSNVQIKVGEIKLGINNVNQYRPEIVKSIYKYLALIHDKMGELKVANLKGLEKPIKMRYHNENEVQLFLEYELEIKR